MTRFQKTRPARKPPPRISGAGLSVFAELARQTKFVDPALAEYWPQIVGPDIAALARPGRITGGPGGRSLEVYVRSGAAATQIQMAAADLTVRVNRYLGVGAVSRILIKQTTSAPSAEPTKPAEDGRLGAALANFRAAVNRRNKAT